MRSLRRFVAARCLTPLIRTALRAAQEERDDEYVSEAEEADQFDSDFSESEVRFHTDSPQNLRLPLRARGGFGSTCRARARDARA